MAWSTPNYELSKNLVPVFKPLESNKFTVKDSFHFAEQQADFFLGSLDVEFLYTNLHLEETIEFFTNEHFKESETTDGRRKSQFKELLSLATKDFFMEYLIIKLMVWP